MTSHPPSRRPWSIALALGACVLSTSMHLPRMAQAQGAPSPAAPFAGTFSGDNLTLELSESGGNYTGTINQGDDKFPAKAIAAGQTLAGTFVVGDHEFTFAATFSEGRLMLVSGGKTHALTKTTADPASGIKTAAAPAPKIEQPPRPAVAGGPVFDTPQTFGNFTVLGATDKGKTLFIQLPSAQTLESVLTQAADELAKGLDARPALSGAFADSKARNTGGVSLTGKLKGQPIRGVIFCGAQPRGGSATVILAAANASKEDLEPLYRALPAPPPQMTTHKFPDGSGSVDLPDGWTTPDNSAAHGIGVQGPAGQVVVFGRIAAIYDPNCRLVRTAQQTYQIAMGNYKMQLQAYQRGVEMRKRYPNIIATIEPKEPVAPDPDPNIQFPNQDFCAYCDGPEDLLKTWYPIREEKQKRAGGPYTSLDKIIEVIPLPGNPLQPKSKAGIAYLALTDHDGNKVTHARSLIRLQTAHIMDGEVWQFAASNMRAPEESFDRDLPVMNAIMNSVKLDMNVVNKETWAQTNASLKMGQEMFEQLQKQGRDFNDQQAIRFNNHQMQIAAQEKARHDSASDYIEYIGGVRRVYDTQTGQSLNVNLFNSNGIVNGLNAGANDPNRFVQIPLRYER